MPVRKTQANAHRNVEEGAAYVLAHAEGVVEHIVWVGEQVVLGEAGELAKVARALRRADGDQVELDAKRAQHRPHVCDQVPRQLLCSTPERA